MPSLNLIYLEQVNVVAQ